jgi:hypothetical protein
MPIEYYEVIGNTHEDKLWAKKNVNS